MDDRMVDLVAENMDAALRLGTLTDSALQARKLAQADRVAVASPAYLARKGVPSTPADLLDHHGIIYGQHAGGLLRERGRGAGGHPKQEQRA